MAVATRLEPPRVPLVWQAGIPARVRAGAGCVAIVVRPLDAAPPYAVSVGVSGCGAVRPARTRGASPPKAPDRSPLFLFGP